jgi:hypothetical protein
MLINARSRFTRLLCGYAPSLVLVLLLTVVQKIALTAYRRSSAQFKLEATPAEPTAKPPFGSRLTLSDRFTRRRSAARITWRLRWFVHCSAP